MESNNHQQASTAKYVTDREMAPVISVSVGFLQKDRIGPQRIPFVRLGDRCLYNVEEVLAAVRAMSVGGPRGRRGRATGAA